MSIIDNNPINQNFIDSLSNMNDEQDILDEFLDQRVYDNITSNLNPTSMSNSSPSSLNNSSNDIIIKDVSESLENFMNEELSLSLNANDYLDMDNMVSDDQQNESFYKQDNLDNSKSVLKSDMFSKNSNNITVNNINMDNDFQAYEIARNDLSKLKFGNTKIEKSVQPIDLPSEYLNFDTDSPYKLSISGLPTYSRVETQIKVKLSLSPPPSQFLVHLSSDLISKSKFCLTNDLPESIKPNLLFLDTFVLTSDNRSCNICPRCIKREQKRASRRKSGLNDENSNWDDDIKKKAIIFNCKEIISFPPPNGLEVEKSIDLSARIICYCRHHRESKGFKLLFVIKNHLGEIVAKSLSSSIMIMDRKKNTSTSFENNSTSNGLNNLQPLSPTSIDESSSEPHTTDSRSLKRKKYSMDDSRSIISSTSTSVNALGFSNNIMSNSNNNLSPLSDTTSNIFRSPTNPSVNLNFMDTYQASSNLPAIQRIIPAQGPIRGGIEVTLLGCNFRPGLIVKFGSNQALATHCWSDSTIVTYLPPASQSGQVLVSFENYDSNNQPVLNQVPQQVFTYLDDTDRQLIELALQIVGLKMNGKLEDARNIARRIVGTDNKDSTSGSNSHPPASQPNSPNDATEQDNETFNDVEQEWYHNAHKTVNQLTASNLTTEEMLLNFLSLIDLPNCPTTPNFQICTSQGQTLLHLATIKNCELLIRFLITHGCKVDSKDNQGLTPLFYAGLIGNRNLMQLFIDCKSNWKLRLSNGKSIRDYCDLNVLDIFNDLESDNDSNTGSDEDEFGNSKIFKKVSSDSLNSLFTQDYGSHISKIVNSRNISIESVSATNDSAFYQSYEAADDGSGYDDDSEADADFEDDVESLGGTDTQSTSTAIVPSVSSDPAPTEDLENVVSISNSTLNRDRSESNGIWQRVRNVFNNESQEEESLPAYDDLFPSNGSSSIKSKETLLVRTENSQQTQGTSAIDSITEIPETSEDIVESFISKRKQFRHDKMLLFFWLPVLLALIGIFIFGDILQVGAKLQDFLRSGLVTILIGNERVKDVFTNVNIAVNAVTSAAAGN